MHLILISAGTVKVTPLYGVYDVSVYVNDQPIINQSITFNAIEGKKNAQACITLKNLLQFHNINSPDINNEKAVLLAGG